MAFKDYYKILGVEKTATPEAIKKSFRKLAVQYHPDKNKGDKRAEEKFKEINEANTVLSDPEKRKRYDQFGENWEHFQEGGGGAGRPGGQSRRQQPGGRGGTQFQFDANDFENDESMEDLLRQFFGSQQAGRRGRSANSFAMDGADLEAEVPVTLEDAFAGTTRLVKIGEETHRLPLKKGVRDGQLFRLRGKGQPGSNGGQPGDVLIHVRVTPHPRYTRNGNDLRCRQHLDLVTAVLGGKIRVTTLHGDKMMSIPPGTQNGASLRMRGMGMPDYERPDIFGDLYLDILVDIPQKLTPEEHRLFSQLAALKNQ